jgi:hypothetical protein
MAARQHMLGDLPTLSQSDTPQAFSYRRLGFYRQNLYILKPRFGARARGLTFRELRLYEHDR